MPQRVTSTWGVTKLTGMSLMDSIVEQWRPIPGWEGFYEVSDMGRVRSLDRDIPNSRGAGTRRMRGKLLKPKKYPNGYRFVQLSRGYWASQKERQVSHLVLEAFVGPRPEGFQACHNNGDNQDDQLENLRWDTPKNNNADKKEHGTHRKGREMWQSVLDENKVKAIRLEYRKWGRCSTNRYELARKYGVDIMTISHIVWGDNWKHVDPPAAPAHLEWQEKHGKR